MDLDRSSIARRDFPLERRGYDRAAVDAHLDAIATAVAELAERAGAAAADPSAASTVSGQVASIVAAAEDAARRIEAEAEQRAREHDARAKSAAEELMKRIETLRAGVERLVGEVPAPVVAAPVAPRAEPPAAPAPPAPPAPHAAPPPPANGEADPTAAARLVALQMLLEGSSRAEVDTYLTEHFDLPDRAGLLDEVAAAAGA